MITRENIYDASVLEVVEFLKQEWGVRRLVFEGNFVTEGVDLTRLRGMVTDITLEGKHVVFPFSNVAFDRISVRKNGELKNTLQPGPCRFSCLIAPPEIRRQRNEPFLLSVDLRSIKNISLDESVVRKPTFASSRVPDNVVAQVMKRLRLSDRFFIGQFSPLNEDWIISDLRNADFTKIEDKERGVKNPTIRVRGDMVTGINKFAYYKFGWVLLKDEPLKFGFDANAELTPIYPKDIVRCLHDSIINYPSSASKKNHAHVGYVE